MSYQFHKKIFGFLDLLRFKKATKIRRKRLAEGSNEPLPTTYRVNETAKILHPGMQCAELIEIRNETSDMKTFTFLLERPMFFRAGQYITVRAKVGDSLVSRPYAISSSPNDAFHKLKLSVTVRKAGFFSNFLVDEAKIGLRVTVGEASGEFFYEPIKDRPLIVGIGGGCGITPFYSMAQSIAQGTEDCRLTLFYGTDKEDNIAFRKEFDALVSDKFKVIYVLNDELKAGMEQGFVTAEIIKKYVSDPFTAMVCGPKPMYNFIDKQLKSFDLEQKHIKYEAMSIGVRDVKPQKFSIRVKVRDEVFNVDADSRETILNAMERSGLQVPAKCRSGGCGFCHSKLVSGKFSIADADKRRLADAKFGYIHPCCSYPDSNMELIVPKG